MGQYHYRNPLHQMEQNAKDKNPIKTVNFEQYAERHWITNRLMMPVPAFFIFRVSKVNFQRDVGLCSLFENQLIGLSLFYSLALNPPVVDTCSYKVRNER